MRDDNDGGCHLRTRCGVPRHAAPLRRRGLTRRACSRRMVTVTTTYPCRDAGGGLLEQVPQHLLVVRALALAELLLVPLPQRFGLFAHLLVHVLLALVVLVLATRLQVQLVNAPVLQIVTERQHTHLVDQMQLARPVEVQHLWHTGHVRGLHNNVIILIKQTTADT